MKKKLLALAVAGAFVAPVAMADTANVNVYGVFDASLDSTRTGGNNSANQTKISSNASRVGFKGSEDLGGGTNAVFQIEQGVNVDTGTWGSANRNTFVGLSGESWGAVLLGNNDSSYKSSTRKMDLFMDSIADNRSLMGGVGGKSAVITFDRRSPNSITYNSPDFSGVKISAQYNAGAELAASGTSKGSAWSLAGTYAAGPISAALAYENHDFGDAVGDMQIVPATFKDKKERSYKLAGGYAVDQFAVNVIFEKTSDDLGAGGRDAFDHRTWYIGGKFNVSAGDAVKLAYTKMNDVGDANETGARQMSIGYDHAMSKRTTVYALYTRLDNDKSASYSLGFAGASTGAVTGVAADSDPSAFAIGVKHTF